MWYFFGVPREAGRAGFYLRRKPVRGGADGGSSDDHARIPMPEIPIVYVELPSNGVAADKQFYGSLFGWSFQDYGPDYASFSDSGLAGGLNGSNEGRPKAPLLVLDTDDLEAMLARVVAAGGTISLPIFSFPGGRRFHFTDPSGNELAVMQRQ
jgi:predicted enzyme related to lactoylglutathione lyase